MMLNDLTIIQTIDGKESDEETPEKTITQNSFNEEVQN